MCLCTSFLINIILNDLKESNVLVCFGCMFVCVSVYICVCMCVLVQTEKLYNVCVKVVFLLIFDIDHNKLVNVIFQGDSGSPLAINNVVVGLTSYSGPKCENSRIGFYVNVLNYMPWIKSVIGL